MYIGIIDCIAAAAAKLVQKICAALNRTDFVKIGCVDKYTSFVIGKRQMRNALKSTFLVLLAIAMESACLIKASAAEIKQPLLDNQIKQLLAESLDGYKAGGILIKPEASVSRLYDNNIYATRNNQIADFINIYDLNISARSISERNRVSLDAGGSLGRYQTHSLQNYNDYWSNLGGQLDVTNQLKLFGGAGYSHGHEPRGSPEAVLVGTIPTFFRSTTGYAGLAYKQGRFSLRTGGTVERLRYDDAYPITNQDRNRDLLGFGAKFGYAISPRYTLYLQGIRDVRRYAQKPDDFGYFRDSNGYRADIGLDAILSNRLRGGIHVGKLHQHFRDARFANVNALDFGAHLLFREAPRTVWTASLERSLEDTILDGSSSYIYTTLSGGVKHLVSPRVRLHAAVSASQADFQDTNRRDAYYTALLGMRYYMTPAWYLGAEYRVQGRDSNVQEAVNNPASVQLSEDYGKYQALLTLGGALYPVARAPGFDAAAGERIAASNGLLSGFYVGAQAGSDSLSLDTVGVRGTGTDYGMYSKTSPDGGLFAGYGYNLDPLYVGVEVDGESGNTGIYHQNDNPNSRTISVAKKDTQGVSARLGYTLPTGALLYGRYGWVRSRFNTYFTQNSALQNAYQADKYVTGTRFGLGMDIPLSDIAFARLDYTYTRYKDILADAVTEAEQISPHEDLFRLGLGWQLGGRRATRRQQLPPIHDGGFYAGVQFSRSVLQSELDGVLVTNPGVASNFTGNFGGSYGMTGAVFAGYGVTLHHIYLGIEGDVDDSSAAWGHDRTPTGRNFSVSQKESFGLGLRAGYALDDGTLLYLRFGGVRTRFNTTWSKGGNALADVDRDDRLYGLKYGVGADVPITVSSFLRVAYAFTDYRKYNFVTSQSFPDSMQFSNKQSEYSLGLGIRM